jgi:hypothetical protein
MGSNGHKQVGNGHRMGINRVLQPAIPPAGTFRCLFATGRTPPLCQSQTPLWPVFAATIMHGSGTFQAQFTYPSRTFEGTPGYLHGHNHPQTGLRPHTPGLKPPKWRNHCKISLKSVNIEQIILNNGQHTSNNRQFISNNNKVNCRNCRRNCHNSKINLINRQVKSNNKPVTCRNYRGNCRNGKIKSNNRQIKSINKQVTCRNYRFRLIKWPFNSNKLPLRSNIRPLRLSEQPLRSSKRSLGSSIRLLSSSKPPFTSSKPP